MGKINLAERIFKREYDRLQEALGGGVLHELVCQYYLQRAAHPYYNSRAGGGEGHLEVAKSIYYTNKGICHMVLSLKPFGCMPSTQSDGVQAAVMEHHKDMIFLPIETSGEGEINAHSRVQMALGNARVKAKQEFSEALEKTGRTLDEMRAYVDVHPVLKFPTYVVPKHEGIVGRAANFVLHVTELMDSRAHRTAKVA
ncbi:MAG: activator of (R)-2-hydroxyglutaryl-CoA dehydratase, partial [Candidatus Krumholzibacteria bacterium]|nr:activator of (R)-2-hydroxyglutaryl-CoA dehydratase [Candidatus Krumholzibacteria bacterium]